MDSFVQAAPLYLSEGSLTWALVVSALLGAILGLERSIAGKHAGMRTYALVSLGSCLFVIIGILSSFQLSFFASISPLQIASSVVVGIGFIGSGLAVFRGDHPSELTTATGIWVAAGIGMACGFGYYFLATATTVLGLIIFSLLLKFENAIRKRWSKSTE